MYIRTLARLLSVMSNGDAGGGGGGGANGGDASGGGGSASGDAGGGNPFGGAKGGASGGAGGNGAGGAPGGTGAPYYPEKLPDHLRGANERETLDKLFGAYSGMREEISKRGTVPKDANEYQLAVPDDVAKVLGSDLSKDRSAQIYRQIALKHGLTDKQAVGLFSDFMSEQVGAGLIKTVDPRAEARKVLGNGAAGLSDDQVMDKAAERWQTLQDQIGGLVANKSINDGMAAAAKQLTNTADGMLLLETMFAKMGERGINTGGNGGQGGGITKADLDKRWNDPRTDPRHPQYDKAFADETDRLGREFFGSGKAA